MKTMMIMLILILSGCGATPDKRLISTLSVINDSGGTVKIYIDNDRTIHLLRRVWPGKECIKLPNLSSSSVAFGIRHLGFRTVWTETRFMNDFGFGWSLEIHQPRMAVFDMLDLRPSERCG